MITRLLILVLITISKVSYSQEYDHQKNSEIEFTSELPSLADEEDPIRSNPLYEKANQFVREMLYYAAISVYDSLYLTYEKNKLLLLGRGMCHKKVENYDLAMKDYNTLLEIDSLNAAAWSNRGMLHMAMGNLDLALSDYDISIELATEEAGMYYNRFWVYFYQDNFEMACKDLESAIKFGFTENFGPEAQELLDYYCKNK
ncbi:MAG: hypothetical protein HRT58_00175 [Crocinitomicaceae bacterium]|nr:hypothetical protein [Flavobacteriales bacterium]NQZ34036.1 hypothetical protein [Crocinitomicaceae bacterium]